MEDTSTMEDLKKMKVAELKQALKDRGLPTSGTKPELMKRLCSALGTEVDQGGDDIDDELEDDILNDDTTVPAPAEAPAASRSLTQTAVKPVQAKPLTAQAQNIQLTERKETTNVATTDTTVKSKVAQVEKLTPEERMKMRAEKFGAVSLDTKKQMRAERFGLASGDKSTALSGSTGKTAANDVDLLKKRAERFGAVTSTSLSKVDQDERKRKRAERFGMSNTTSVKTTVSINSADPDLEAKKKKRAERFGIKT